MSDTGARIEEANRRVLGILLQGRPIWVGDRPAMEVIPGMTKTTVLHAGPPIPWDRMCGPMRLGIVGGVLFEGLARNRREAEDLISSGEITLAPCHEHRTVGGMTGITTASMPVHVVRNDAFGNEAYCAPHEGYSPKGFEWGTYDEETIAHVRWQAEVMSPVLDAGLRAIGGLDVRGLVARAVQMGDECHGRCTAATLLIVSQLAPHLVSQGLSPRDLSETLRFLRDSEIFGLHVIMAAAKSLLDTAKGVEYSTIVTAIARNGVELGIKVSALGDEWFTGPAGRIKTTFFSPDWTDDDAVPDLGDSSIVEGVGLGGMIHAASPAQEQLMGGSFDDAMEKTEHAYAITAGEHEAWRIPTLDFRGVPLGIDIRKVLEIGRPPLLDTATAHKEGGKIGVGEALAPMEAFERALRAYGSKYRL